MADILHVTNLDGVVHGVRQPFAKHNYQYSIQGVPVSDLAQFVMLCVWLWLYPVMPALTAMFGFNVSDTRSVTRFVCRALRASAHALRDYVVWPSDEERGEHFQRTYCRNFLVNFFDRPAVVVDGTEITIQTPTLVPFGSPEHKAAYSSKKHQYAINVLVVSLLDGTPI